MVNSTALISLVRTISAIKCISVYAQVTTIRKRRHNLGFKARHSEADGLSFLAESIPAIGIFNMTGVTMQALYYPLLLGYVLYKYPN